MNTTFLIRYLYLTNSSYNKHGLYLGITRHGNSSRTVYSCSWFKHWRSEHRSSELGTTIIPTLQCLIHSDVWTSSMHVPFKHWNVQTSELRSLNSYFRRIGTNIRSPILEMNKLSRFHLPFKYQTNIQMAVKSKKIYYFTLLKVLWYFWKAYLGKFNYFDTLLIILQLSWELWILS